MTTRNDNDNDDISEVESQQRKRMKLIDDEMEKLQNEKDTMNNSIRDDVDSAATATTRTAGIADIVKISAGGKVFKALRSTLTLAPDTMLTNMFSGRWEGSLQFDDTGCVFLDEDPELIEIIINFLREKKRESPSKPVKSPMIRKEKEASLDSLLDYYGLTEFCYPYIPLNIDAIEVVEHEQNYVNVTRTENMIQFSKRDPHIGSCNEHDFLACKPALDSSGGGSFWKVTNNDDLPPDDTSCWIYLGIIGKLWVSDTNSADDSTSYGWESGSLEDYHGEVNNHERSGRTDFTKGECLYFHLRSNKLTMYNVQQKKKFTINVSTTVDAYYIHFNMYTSGTKITLEPLNEEEKAQML